MSLERASEVRKFNEYARGYTAAHARSVRASGEAPEFFAAHKVTCLERAGVRPTDSVLDYGCGTGSLTGLLARRFGAVAGYDPSADSLEVARQAAPSAAFYSDEYTIPTTRFDVAVLSGVLHHVPPPERLGVVSLVASKLKPEGRLFVFEHNPFNPLTRRAVRACPFDDEAVLLAPWELRRLLARSSLVQVQQDYVLFFPRPLARLRPLEPALRRCPLGAQTLTVGTRAS